MAKKYSSKERKAYHNGVNAVNGRKKKLQSACMKCGTPLYVVDGDGVVVQVLGGAK